MEQTEFFITRPLYVKAMQYNGENYTELFKAGFPLGRNNEIVHVFVRSLNGFSHAVFLHPTDWVLKTEQGSFTVCTDDVFQQLFRQSHDEFTF